MSLLNKIGDKLSSSKHNNDERTSQELDSNRIGTTGDYSTSTGNTTSAKESRQHPFGSGLSGTAISGGTAVDNNNTNVPGSYPQSTHGRDGSILSSPTGHGNTTSSSIIPDRTRNDGTTTTTTSTVTRLGGNNRNSVGNNVGSTTDHNSPRQPYDPYSSKGQQIAANAAEDRSRFGTSHNHGTTGGISSRRDNDDSDVHRTHGGGVSNGQQLHTGPHSDLENRDAVPVAGGQKLGTGAAYDSPSHGSQHHYGRDAGTASYGTTHGRNESDHKESTTVGPHKSDLLNKLDPRVTSDPNKAYEQGHTSSNSTGFGNRNRGNSSNDYDSRDRNYDSRDQYNSRNNNSTAGPHKSDTANKIDPRVDADQSKAYPFDNYGTSHHRSHNSRDQYDSRDNYNSRDNNYDSRDNWNSRGNNYNSRDNNYDSRDNWNSRGNNNSRDDYNSRDNYDSRDNWNSRDNNYNSRDNWNSRDNNNHNSRDNRDSKDQKTTAGPHSSNLLNKLDPRVDSDRSKENRDYDDNNDNYNSSSSRNRTSTSRDRDQHHYGSRHNNNPNDNSSFFNRSGADQPLSQNRDFNNRHNNNNNNSGQSNQAAGFDHAKRLGGAYGAGYEAGYRDAMLHAEQDRVQGRGNYR